MTVQRALLMLILCVLALPALAQSSTAFTYQGRLYNNGVLANGSYTLRITPYGQLTGGTTLTPPFTTPALNVVDGIFSTTLDFGAGVFLGSPVWLSIEVQAPASTFITLAPRQPVTPTPYAINADKVDGLDAAQLAGVPGPPGPPGTPGAAGGLIPFSTGVANGASMTSSAPLLMGFGNSRVQTIDGSGQSTSPPEANGFAFPIPFTGTITNLQVSVDLLVASVVSINELGLQYDFTVFRAPSAPNNGIDHLAAPFVTTPLTASVRFGFPNTVVTAGTFRTATAFVAGPLAVTAGDRIGIRVRTLASTDSSAPDVAQLSFSATLSYVRN